MYTDITTLAIKFFKTSTDNKHTHSLQVQYTHLFEQIKKKKSTPTFGAHSLLKTVDIFLPDKYYRPRYC